MTVLELRAVSYRYAGAASAALSELSLSLAAGRVLGVVGPNDGGKSTLCLVAAGLAPGTIGGRLDGSVRLGGTETVALAPHEAAQRCGILFQNPATQLTGTATTVWEEIAFGPRNLGLDLGAIAERVAWAMGLTRTDHLAAKETGRLSGGQAQLVALAAVLAMQPAVLVLDEPTSQLDPAGTLLVGDALARLAAETGTAILVVEHKTALLARMADEIVVLDGGRIVLRDATRTVLADPRLADLGVEPPAAVRLERMVRARGLTAALQGIDLVALEQGRAPRVELEADGPS